MSIVKQVLETDAKYRCSGVEGDLFSLGELTPNEWVYELPTLCRKDTHKGYNFGSNEMKKMTIESFKTKLYKQYPALKGIDMSNVLIAGGCVGEFIFSNSNVNDVDIFIYGLTPEQATTRIIKLFTEITENLYSIKKAENKRSDYTPTEDTHEFRRTQGAITMDGKYQVILRLYQTKSEILHGFDLGSSAVGFDGENLLFTTLSKFSYEYCCNIVDTTRRSTTYELRLRKYFERGFKIIVPNLDISKLRNDLWEDYETSEACKLPFLPFLFNYVDGKAIYVYRFLEKKSKVDTDSSDYDMDVSQIIAFKKNVEFLLNNETERIVYFSENIKEILLEPSVFRYNYLKSLYNDLEDKCLSNKFPRYTIPKYVKGENIVERILKSDEDELSQIMDSQLETTYKLAQQFENSSKVVKFKTENPGSQLTSSFNPIIEDVKVWYGTYWVEN